MDYYKPDKKEIRKTNKLISQFVKEYKTYTDINTALADIKSEFYIIANESLDIDFIEKAILHYKYLDKNYGIKSGVNKFTLDTTSENEAKTTLQLIIYSFNFILLF